MQELIKELEELKAKNEKIKKEAQNVYGTCRDGSFELALEMWGYNANLKKLKEIERQLSEVAL